MEFCSKDGKARLLEMLFTIQSLLYTLILSRPFKPSSTEKYIFKEQVKLNHL